MDIETAKRNYQRAYRTWRYWIDVAQEDSRYTGLAERWYDRVEVALADLDGAS